MGNYLKHFKTYSEYEGYINDDPILPNVSIADDTPDFVGYNPWHEPTQPNDEIWYTTTDGNIFDLLDPSVIGLGQYEYSIISNTYENGKGVMKFNQVIENVGINLNENKVYPFFVTMLMDGSVYGETLSSITLPNSVVGIYSAVFSKNMYSITVPDSVRIIGDYPVTDTDVSSDANLRKLIIGKSVETIGKMLIPFPITEPAERIEITIYATTPPIIDRDTIDYLNFSVIYVPSESVEVYKSAPLWNYMADFIQAMPGN